MNIISKKLLLSCSLAALLTISPGHSFANDLAAEITEEVVSIAAETMLKTPINVGRGEIDEPGDLLDLPINGIIDSIVKKSLEKSIGTLVERGIIQGSGDVWVDRIATRVLTQVRSSLSSSSGVSGKLNSATAGTFATGILVGVTLDIASEVVEEELVSAGHPYLGPAIGYGIQQGKVAYAAKTGGPLGAVVAQTMITGKQLGRVYQLSIELEEEMNDARAASAYANAASDALRLRTRYMQADSKPQIESQIRQEMRDSLSDYYGDDLPPEAEHYIDTIIYQYQSAEVRKYEVAQGLAEEILQNPENAGAYRDRAEEFISRNFSSEERNRLTSLTNDLYASIASDQVTEMRSLLNGLARSETPEEDRQRLIVLAKSVDPELSRIESEQRLLETIVQNLEKYERAFGQDTTAVQVLTETSGVISSLERKKTTPSEPDLCDSYDCNNSLAETPREELPPETNTGDAERLAAEQERQAELDRQETERLEQERQEVIQRRIALVNERNALVQEQDGISNQLNDAQARLQEARNKLAVSRYNDLEIVDAELRRVRSELASLSRRVGDQTKARDLQRERSILIRVAKIVRQLYLGQITVDSLTSSQRNRLTLMGIALGYTTAGGKPIWETVAENARFTAGRILSRISAIDRELSRLNPLSASERRRLDELKAADNRLTSQKQRILAKINQAESDVVRYQRMIADLENQFRSNEQRLAQLGYDIESYESPNFRTPPPTDWANYNSPYEATDTSDLSDESKVELPSQPTNPNPQPGNEHWTGGVTGLDQSPASIFSVTTGGDIDTLPPSVGDTVAIKVTDPSSPTFERAGTVQGQVQGKYQYTAWGEWSGSISVFNNGIGQRTTFNRGLFVMGQPTPKSYVDQRTGTATYSGSLLGDYASHTTGVIPNSVTGSVNLTANFSSSTMTGNLNMSGPNGFTANTTANASFYTRGSSGAGYGGSLTGPNGNGGIDGTFFGPTAQETGGTFWFFTNTGENATGIFHAQD